MAGEEWKKLPKDIKGELIWKRGSTKWIVIVAQVSADTIYLYPKNKKEEIHVLKEISFTQIREINEVDRNVLKGFTISLKNGEVEQFRMDHNVQGFQGGVRYWVDNLRHARKFWEDKEIMKERATLGRPRKITLEEETEASKMLDPTTPRVFITLWNGEMIGLVVNNTSTFSDVYHRLFSSGCHGTCPTCKLRHQFCKLWAVDTSGTKRAVSNDEILTDLSRRGDLLFVMEYNQKLLIVHFSDISYEILPAPAAITAEEVLKLDVIASKLNYLGCFNAGLFLKVESGTELLFDKNDKPFKYPLGKFLVRSKAARVNSKKKTKQEVISELRRAAHFDFYKRQKRSAALRESLADQIERSSNAKDDGLCFIFNHFALENDVTWRSAAGPKDMPSHLQKKKLSKRALYESNGFEITTTPRDELHPDQKYPAVVKTRACNNNDECIAAWDDYEIVISPQSSLASDGFQPRELSKTPSSEEEDWVQRRNRADITSETFGSHPELLTKVTSSHPLPSDAQSRTKVTSSHPLPSDAQSLTKVTSSHHLPNDAPPLTEVTSSHQLPSDAPPFTEVTSSLQLPSDAPSFTEVTSSHQLPNDAPPLTEVTSSHQLPSDAPPFTEVTSSLQLPSDAPSFTEVTSSPQLPSDAPPFTEVTSSHPLPSDAQPDEAKNDVFVEPGNAIKEMTSSLELESELQPDEAKDDELGRPGDDISEVTSSDHASRNLQATFSHTSNEAEPIKCSPSESKSHLTDQEFPHSDSNTKSWKSPEKPDIYRHFNPGKLSPGSVAPNDASHGCLTPEKTTPSSSITRSFSEPCPLHKQRALERRRVSAQSSTGMSRQRFLSVSEPDLHDVTCSTTLPQALMTSEPDLNETNEDVKVRSVYHPEESSEDSDVSVDFACPNPSPDYPNLMTSSSGAAWGLARKVEKAVNRILAVKECSIEMNRVINDELCPPLLSILESGLKTSLLKSFFSRGIDVWSIIETVSKSTQTAERLVSHIKSGKVSEKFRQFVCACVRKKYLGQWFELLSDEKVQARISSSYERHAMALDGQNAKAIEHLKVFLDKLNVVELKAEKYSRHTPKDDFLYSFE